MSPLRGAGRISAHSSLQNCCNSATLEGFWVWTTFPRSQHLNQIHVWTLAKPFQSLYFVLLKLLRGGLVGVLWIKCTSACGREQMARHSPSGSQKLDSVHLDVASPDWEISMTLFLICFWISLDCAMMCSFWGSFGLLYFVRQVLFKWLIQHRFGSNRAWLWLWKNCIFSIDKCKYFMSVMCIAVWRI